MGLDGDCAYKNFEIGDTKTIKSVEIEVLEIWREEQPGHPAYPYLFLKAKIKLPWESTSHTETIQSGYDRRLIVESGLDYRSIEYTHLYDAIAIRVCAIKGGEAEGKIIAHNINKLPCPNCGEAKEGQEIEVIMGMKNIGDAEGEFRFYIYDQDGGELSKEPDFSYKNINAGDTWGVSKTFTTNLNFKMLNKTLNGRVELRRQT